MTRAKKLIKLMDKLVKQDHLYSDEQLREMKSQLRMLRGELEVLENKTSKGFGKK
jgi:hypothetical protein